MTIKGHCIEVIKLVQIHFFVRSFGQAIALKVSQFFAVFLGQSLFRSWYLFNQEIKIKLDIQNISLKISGTSTTLRICKWTAVFSIHK